MQLMTSNKASTSETMTSLELRQLINDSRAENQEPEIRLNKLNEKIADELEWQHYPKSVVKNPNGTESEIYHLTRDQCTLVGMRESKAVRRSVLAKLKSMGAATPEQTPAVKDPQLAAMVMMLTQLDSVKQEQEAQRLELADLRAKVTATPDEYYTVAGYASLRGISLDTKRANLLGRKAAKVSREHGVDIGKAHSSIYGEVNTYHVDVLCEIFE